MVKPMEQTKAITFDKTLLITYIIQWLGYVGVSKWELK